MADSDYERIVCVKNEVFVYNIPARTSNRGYRAAEWNLDSPSWTGRMRCVAKDKVLQLKLEDRNTGELFAMCPVDTYPGIAVEQVLDSSRYFVVQIQDPSGRHAFIGIGFADRADSFDLLVTMQDHFKWLKREEREKEQGVSFENTGPKLDLSFKEGQTIKINLGGEDSKKRKPRARNSSTGTLGLLPPPPGGAKPAAPPRAAGVVLDGPPPTNSPIAPVSMPTSAGAHFLFDLDTSGAPSQTAAGAASGAGSVAAQPVMTADPWGDFTSAGSTNTTSSTQNAQSSGGWVQF